MENQNLDFRGLAAVDVMRSDGDVVPSILLPAVALVRLLLLFRLAMRRECTGERSPRERGTRRPLICRESAEEGMPKGNGVKGGGMIWADCCCEAEQQKRIERCYVSGGNGRDRCKCCFPAMVLAWQPTTCTRKVSPRHYMIAGPWSIRNTDPGPDSGDNRGTEIQQVGLAILEILYGPRGYIQSMSQTGSQLG